VLFVNLVSDNQGHADKDAKRPGPRIVLSTKPLSTKARLAVKRLGRSGGIVAKCFTWDAWHQRRYNLIRFGRFDDGFNFLSDNGAASGPHPCSFGYLPPLVPLWSRLLSTISNTTHSSSRGMLRLRVADAFDEQFLLVPYGLPASPRMNRIRPSNLVSLLRLRFLRHAAGAIWYRVFAKNLRMKSNRPGSSFRSTLSNLSAADKSYCHAVDASRASVYASNRVRTRLPALSGAYQDWEANSKTAWQHRSGPAKNPPIFHIRLLQRVP
jgi:hypothetical protein